MVVAMIKSVAHFNFVRPADADVVDPVHGPPLTGGAIGDGSRPVHESTGQDAYRTDGQFQTWAVRAARWGRISAVRGVHAHVPELTVSSGIILVRLGYDE